MNESRLRYERHGFTLMELLVVIGILVTLMAILLPAVSRARLSSYAAVSSSNLRQLGMATSDYLTRWNNHLPQMAWDVGGGQMQIIGALFGGKKGQLPFYGINEVGAVRRPLNRYVRPGVLDMDPKSREIIQMEEFLSPLDTGQPDTGFGAATTLYDYLGSSYTLNDHANTSEAHWTLVPRVGPDGTPGGRMPRVADPTKTWLLAEHPIYNYQEGGDRGQAWYAGNVKAAMIFVDGHTRASVPIPPQPVNTTPDYTYLPSPDWLDQF